MRAKLHKQVGLAFALLGLLAWGAPATLAQEIPAGTRFAVELRDKLEAKYVKRGKEFNARTLEALHASDGSVIPAGTKVKGRVAYARDNEMVLDFFRIETRRGRIPISATVVSVPGEKDVKRKAGREGEIKSEGGRAKGAGIGALIGAGAGAAGGALIGAAAGGKDLVLRKGTELELQLDRPLYYARR